MKYQQQEA